MGLKPRLRAYDKAKHHFSAADFPLSLPQEAGAKHIAWFLRWAAENGNASEAHARMLSSSLGAAAYFMKECDGSLTDEDLDGDGNAFARAHYDDYLRAYQAHFAAIAKPTYLVLSGENSS